MLGPFLTSAKKIGFQMGAAWGQPVDLASLAMYSASGLRVGSAHHSSLLEAESGSRRMLYSLSSPESLWYTSWDMRTVLRFAAFTLDLKNRVLKSSGASQHLTPIECRLLQTLVAERGRVVTRKTLMKEVWNTDYMGDTRTLDVHVCWLRKKLKEHSDHRAQIRTIRGVGYRFDVQ